MTEANLMGLVTACVFGAAAVVPYVVSALRPRRPGAARQSRRSMM